MISSYFFHMAVHLDDHMVSISDAEWYGKTNLLFRTLEEAQQCFDQTCQLLQETQNKLITMGWPIEVDTAVAV